MNLTLLIGLTIFIILFLFVRMPAFLIRFVGTSSVRIAIGLLLLVLLNVFGNAFGLHIPINFFTIVASSLLGMAGIISILAIHLFILS